MDNVWVMWEVEDSDIRGCASNRFFVGVYDSYNSAVNAQKHFQTCVDNKYIIRKCYVNHVEGE